MQLVRVPTSAGVVHFHAGELRGDRPLIVMLQGADQILERSAPLVAELRDCDVIIACLSGHNGAPRLAEPSVDVFASAYCEALEKSLAGRRLLFVGESLGGVVGLALGQRPPQNLQGVVAVDPFLVGGTWPLRWIVDNGYAKSVAPTLLANYVHLLDHQKVPVQIVAGDNALGPDEVDPVPSLLSAEDRILIERHVGLSVVSGGHNLLTENPKAVAAIVRGTARSIWGR